MKLAFIGDVHLDDKTPGTRSDDYCLTVIKKLDWIFNWCLNNDVDKIILLGDLFHRREVGGRARNLCLRVFKKYYNKPGFPPVIATVGNHDTGNDLNNLKRTTLWTLVIGGYIKTMEYDPDSKVAFLHHHVHVDEEIKNNGLHHDEALIWSSHASIYTSAYKYAVDFHALDITGPCQLVVTGHVHATYSCKRRDGKMLINPGHIGRNAFLAQTPKHPIQFLVVEHDGSKILSTEYIPIEIAKNYEEVFNLEKINTQKNIRKKVKSLVAQGISGTLEGFSVDAIMKLAKQQIKSKSVLELIYKYLGAAHDRS